MVLVSNDVWLKGAHVLAPWLTGKLSDFSGLFMAPALLATLLRVSTRRGLVAAHVLVGAGFAALKLSSAARQAFVDFGALLGLRYAVAADPTDLLALVSLPVAQRLFGRVAAGESEPAAARHALGLAWRRVLAALAMAVGLAATLGTSAIPVLRPIVTPRAVYARSSDGWLLELDPRSGAERARIGMGVAPGERPVVANDVLYWTTYPPDNDVYAYDLARRQRLWRVKAEQSSFEVQYAAGRLYLIGGSGIEVRDAATGRLLWRAEGRNVASTERSTLVSVDEEIRLYDGPTGVFRGVFARASDTWGFGARSNVKVLDGRLHYVTDTRLVRLGFADERPRSLALPERTWWFNDAPSTPGDTGAPVVLIGALDEARAVDRSSFRTLWTRGEDFAAGCCTAVTSSVVVSTLDEWATALDARTGKPRWRSALQEHASMFATNGDVLVSTSFEGNLVVLDLESGRRLWSRSAPTYD